jgi:hypothetical protein
MIIDQICHTYYNINDVGRRRRRVGRASAILLYFIFTLFSPTLTLSTRKGLQPLKTGRAKHYLEQLE